MCKPKILPLQFPYVPGSASGCSFIDVWRCRESGDMFCESISLKKFSEAIFAHMSRSAQGRFTGDGGRLGGVFQQKFKLDYCNTQ